MQLQIPSEMLEMLYTAAYWYENNCIELRREKTRRVMPEACKSFSPAQFVSFNVTINQYFLNSRAHCDVQMYRSQEWGIASYAF